MSWVFTIGGIFLVIAILAHRKEKRDLQEALKDPNLPDNIIKRLGLKGTKFTSFNGSCTAILDKERKEVHIFSLAQSERYERITYIHHLCKFGDILTSEVIIDSETITSTARGSQVAGAVVGGALLGGIGILAGALSGKTTSKDKIKSINIKLTVNDLDNPICKINFLDTFDTRSNTHTSGYKKDSMEYKYAISEVEKWQGMFDVILQGQS